MKFRKLPASNYFVLLFVMLASACSTDFLPKPKGFNKIDLAPASYKQLEEDHPYSFEYSVHAKVLKDTSLIAEPHWIDIYYPDHKCNIQITYKPIDNSQSKKLDELFHDAHRLKGGHQKKATAIDEIVTRTESGKYVTFFELEGEVPSQFQFYVTDSSKHFLRGALYFRTATKNDSLQPVIDYMKQDILHMMNTLKWKNN